MSVKQSRDVAAAIDCQKLCREGSSFRCICAQRLVRSRDIFGDHRTPARPQEEDTIT